jgi:hypothetical protein
VRLLVRISFHKVCKSTCSTCEGRRGGWPHSLSCFFLMPMRFSPPSPLQSTPYDAPMSNAYVNDTKTLLRRQVALAGYRLAQLLDSSLGGAGRGSAHTLHHPSPALRGTLHTHGTPL